MKYYILWLTLVVLHIIFPSHGGYAEATGVLLGAAVIGAGATVYAANKSSQTAKANRDNQNAFAEAQQKSEAEARQLFDQLISNYNTSKEKIKDGFSLRDYIGAQVEALGDPELKKQYYATKESDFATAQKWADASTTQNISTFNKVLDDVSGGDYKKLVASRNQSILGDDVNAAYARAAELRSSNIPAGSVRRAPDGTALPNSRADKFEFGTAYETVQKANDRMFQKSTQAINDDRTAASRQQVQASAFLPYLDYSAYTTNSVTGPFHQAQLALSQQALSNDAQLASAAMGKAFAGPLPPATISDASNSALQQQGTQLAVAALGQYFTNQQKNSGGYSLGSQPSTTNTQAQSYNLDYTMGSNSGPYN